MAKHRGLSFYHRKKKISSTVVREVFSWIFCVSASIFIATVAVYFFGMSSKMVGVSMESTLYNGQTVLVDRFSYILSSPKAGDVVTFLPNGNEKSHYYIKRIVAVPGDVLYIDGGTLYVNNEECEFVNEKILEYGIAENEFTLGPGEYFCLGDNINNSEDSRSANIGPVKEEYILGKVWFRFKSDNNNLGFIK